MRSIKFRAWDKDKKEMYEWDGTGLGQAKPWWMEDDTPIMQFIGLLDKNGKEIYEGHLIQTKDGTVWLVEPIGSLERDGNNYGLCVSPNGNGVNYFIDKSILAGKIIGHICENPELLKI